MDLLAWLGVSLLVIASSSGGIALDVVYPPVNESDNR